MISRTIRRDELRNIVPLSDSTIYEMEKAGAFPRRFAITPRCVVWDYDEVIAWLRAKKDEGSEVNHRPDVKLRKKRPTRARG